jgi:hypothetical protein
MLFRELAAQLLEVRQARVAEHGCFPVDDQIVRRQSLRRLRDLVELLRPVIAAAGIDPDLAIANVKLRAIAVDLDLVQPVGARGCLLAQGRVARRTKPGKGAAWAPAIPRGARRRDDRRAAPARMSVSRPKPLKTFCAHCELGHRKHSEQYLSQPKPQ